jgi:hypothetical protein
MARQELKVKITAAGRDKGKVFIIREMSSAALEDWAARILLAMTQTGAKLADDIAQRGVAGIASMGIGAVMGGLSIDVARPLLKDMMDCVFIMPDPSNPSLVRPLVDTGNGDDIEELGTRLKLRGDWYQLHTGFSMPVVLSTSPQETGKKRGRPANSRNT